MAAVFVCPGSGQQLRMDKRDDEKPGLFEDDDLDQAIANVDDTGMVRSMQEIREGEEAEHLPPPGDSEPA